MYALTRALQHELGIMSLSDNFGSGTLAALASLGDIGPNVGSANIVNILIGGLYCKGYNAGNGQLPGQWMSLTTVAVNQIQADIGLAQTGVVSPKLFKAILNMDAYVVVGNGQSYVREVQQWLNATYINRSWFFVIPADGSYSRDVQKALVYAIQEELGVAGANGNYGPGTRAAVASRADVQVGSADSGGGRWVRLFQAAMRFNLCQGGFNGTFSSSDSSLVSSFQSFCHLPVTGRGDYQTWSSLLVSNGDPDRAGQAADGITEVTAARAATLANDGRFVIGRYLTSAAGASPGKNIKPGELDVIFAAGMRVFPIFQTSGSSASYFSEARGYSDAMDAVQAASGYGFKRYTVIYFAVDFDALGSDITTRVIPYFRGVSQGMARFGNKYQIGVYGTRNVCIQLAALGLASKSFVAGMSSGYSGNLGFPLPPNWAFDQVATITIGTGAAAIEIDNDIYSGRDPGQSSVDELPAGQTLDVVFDMTQLSAIAQDLEDYCATITESNTFGLMNGSPSDVIADLMQYDTLITSLARAMGIRKALIQTVVFWERWKTIYADPIVDTWVVNNYTYMQNFEAWQEFPVGLPPEPPALIRDDCSTGYAQIFAETAILGHNWAVEQSLADATWLDGSDWHVMWQIWQNLHTDTHYNLAAVPQVLMFGADSVHISGGPRLDYTAAEIQAILARYNGFGEDAANYGAELKPIYDIFESYNAALRP
jgi:peptidoglycan hydrolase-like protein with peptidoglycan-binding domain